MIKKYKSWIIIGISVLVVVFVLIKVLVRGSTDSSDQVQSGQVQPTTTTKSYGSGGGTNSQGDSAGENHMQRIKDHLGL